MDHTESVSPSIPFRSKKPSLHSTPQKPLKISPADSAAPVETPERFSQSDRTRNKNFALSIKDVKRTAQMLRKKDQSRSDLCSDPLQTLRSEPNLQLEVQEKHSHGSVKSGERSVQLPEKYMILCEFFNRMASVIPLFRMRRKASTFANICPKIQNLTDRRFTVKHLAQLKYILPEVIQVKRIRIRDEQTDCMKEDLLITLDTEAVKVGKSMLDLREVFRVRIEDYYEAHSEEDDVPEGELPATFYSLKESGNLSVGMNSCVVPATHVPQFFKRSFSVGEKYENLTVNGTPATELSSNVLATPVKNVLATPIKNVLATPIKNVLATPIKNVLATPIKDRSIVAQSTPAKEAFTPIRATVNTPAIMPSKRCYMTPDDDTTYNPTKLVRRPTRTRSLNFNHPEDEVTDEEQADDAIGSNAESDADDVVSKDLLQSVRGNERKALEEQDPAISQARRRHQLVSGLPKLFDMIRLLFQSINRSVLTKEELLYKIISGHSDIVDRGEVEEHLKLLLELAPEFISEQLCASGDTLVRLNRSISAESVRTKLC